MGHDYIGYNCRGRNYSALTVVVADYVVVCTRTKAATMWAVTR